MKHIRKVMYRSYNGEVSLIAESIYKTSKKWNFENDIYLTTLLERLNKIQKELSESIKQNKEKSILKEKDAARNTALRSIHYLNQGYQHLPDMTKTKAAQILNKTLNKYGMKILKNNYAMKSAHIESLLKDLSRKDLQTAISKLNGIRECITKLEETQHDFINTYITHETAKAKQESQQNATILKKQVLEILNSDLVVYLRATEKAAPDIYGAFSSTIAQIIEDHNEKVKKRNKKL